MRTPLTNITPLKNIRQHTNYHTRHHQADGTFGNIWGPIVDSDANLNEDWFYRRFISRNMHSYNTPFEKRSRHDVTDPVNNFRITWLGHATCLVQLKGLNILTDAVYADRVSPFSFAGPSRRVPIPLSVRDMPQIDAVVYSHNHYDHLDIDLAIKLAKEFKCQFMVPLRVAALLRQHGITDIIELDWWQSIEFKDFQFHCTPARHFSGRWVDDRNQTLWCSWFIEGYGQKIYFAGDTAYSPHFSAIKKAYGAPDVVLMPIGAYTPRSFTREVHVDPAEAIDGFLDLEAAHMVAIHWGTYVLALEPFQEPPQRALEYATSKNIDTNRLHMLPVGGIFQD